MKTHRLWFLLWSVGALGQGREMFVPAYGRQLEANWLLLSPKPADQAPIGALMQILVFLTNRSDFVQKGKIILDKGSTASGTQQGRPGTDVRLFVCTNRGNGGFDWNKKLSATNQVVEAAWELGAKESARFEVSAFMHSKFSESNVNAGHSWINMSFEPVIRVVVDEDKGAVSGSILPLVQGTASGNFCDGSSGVGTSPPLAGEKSGVPLLINGGRPF